MNHCKVAFVMLLIVRGSVQYPDCEIYDEEKIGKVTGLQLARTFCTLFKKYDNFVLDECINESTGVFADFESDNERNAINVQTIGVNCNIVGFDHKNCLRLVSKAKLFCWPLEAITDIIDSLYSDTALIGPFLESEYFYHYRDYRDLNSETIPLIKSVGTFDQNSYNQHIDRIKKMELWEAESDDLWNVCLPHEFDAFITLFSTNLVDGIEGQISTEEDLQRYVSVVCLGKSASRSHWNKSQLDAMISNEALLDRVTVEEKQLLLLKGDLIADSLFCDHTSCDWMFDDIFEMIRDCGSLSDSAIVLMGVLMSEQYTVDMFKRFYAAIPTALKVDDKCRQQIVAPVKMTSGTSNGIEDVIKYLEIFKRNPDLTCSYFNDILKELQATINNMSDIWSIEDLFEMVRLAYMNPNINGDKFQECVKKCAKADGVLLKKSSNRTRQENQMSETLAFRSAFFEANCELDTEDYKRALQNI